MRSHIVTYDDATATDNVGVAGYVLNIHWMYMYNLKTNNLPQILFSVGQLSPGIGSGSHFPVSDSEYEIIFQAVDVNGLSSMCSVFVSVQSTVSFIQYQTFRIVILTVYNTYCSILL